MIKHIKNIFMAAVMTLTLSGMAYAVWCDNGYYANGSSCSMCPQPTGDWANVCEAGTLDADACTNFSNGIGISSSSCGFGTDGGATSISECHIFKYDGLDDDWGIEEDLCKYCDASGCFVLANSCYY